MPGSNVASEVRFQDSREAVDAEHVVLKHSISMMILTQN